MEHCHHALLCNKGAAVTKVVAGLGLIIKIYLLDTAKPMPKPTKIPPLTLFKITLPFEEESLDLAKDEKSA